MKDHRSVITGRLAMLALLLLISSTANAQAAAQPDAGTPTSVKALAAPHHRILFDGAPFSAGSVVPYWDKSFLISRELESTRPEIPNIHLYDAGGKKAREATIWVQGAHRVVLREVALAADGSLVASGFADKPDGSRALFIARTDQSGSMAQVIQTNPFYPSHVCPAPDGTVWSFGGVLNEKPASDGGILRHFDFSKGQIGVFLPRSSFSAWLSPAETANTRQEAFMRCSSSRVAIYSGAAGEYIEVTFSDSHIRRWKIDRSPHDIGVQGFALTESGDVYASYSDQVDTANGIRGLFYLEKNDATGAVRWLPVQGTFARGRQVGAFGHLFGTDGESLVFKRSGDAAVQWARPVPRSNAQAQN